MDFYEINSDHAARGIDGDLESCLGYNPQDGFTVDDIERVLAVFEGERDERDWRWVLQLKNGKFAFLQGWCDYTGWDCQSGAGHAIFDTPEQAAEAPEVENTSSQNTPEVRESLKQQVRDGKLKTWREEKNEEFGLTRPRGRRRGGRVMNELTHKHNSKNIEELAAHNPIAHQFFMLYVRGAVTYDEMLTELVIIFANQVKEMELVTQRKIENDPPRFRVWPFQ